MTEPKNSEFHWTFGPMQKYSDCGAVRIVHPKTTISRAMKVARNAGVSRVAEVTDLDRIGVPNFMTVRPLDKAPGLTYYNGKGTTRSDAHAGALMEAIERHAGESCSYKITVASHRELAKQAVCINPEDLLVPTIAQYNEDVKLEWVTGFDLICRNEVLVPLNFVECPHIPVEGLPFFMSTSNGLASGNSLGEAVCHALCELIERDAQAISLARTQLSPMVRALAGKPRKQEAFAGREISLKDLPLRAQRVVNRMRRANLRVFLRDYSCTAGIATICCTLVDFNSAGPVNAHGGLGCHPDARVALIRALTEASQSRVTCIQGGREDLQKIMSHYTRCSVEEIEEAFGAHEKIAFSDIPSIYNSDIGDDIAIMLSELPKYDIHQVVAFDLTHKDVGIPVVRLVMPRAEAWPIFHLHTGRATLGQRATAFI